MAEATHQALKALGEKLVHTGCFAAEEDRARFNELAARLRRLYEEHIRVEDEELFPLAARVIDAGEQEAIGTEMAERRGIDRAKHREVIAELEGRPWSHRPR